MLSGRVTFTVNRKPNKWERIMAKPSGQSMHYMSVFCTRLHPTECKNNWPALEMPREECLWENLSQWKHFHGIICTSFDPSAFRTCLLDSAFWSCLVMLVHQFGYNYCDVCCQFWHHLHQPKPGEVSHPCIVLPFFLCVISRYVSGYFLVPSRSWTWSVVSPSRLDRSL